VPSIKRILLIEPPVTRPAEFRSTRVRVSPFFPLGLAYIAAVLRRQGYEVGILDALLEGFEEGEQIYGQATYRYGLSDSKIAERIETFRPHAVGVSATFSAKDFDAKSVCRISKQVFPHVPTVVGGAYAGAGHREIMAQEPAVDFVIIGEGEDTFPQLLQAIQSGGGWETIDGLGYRDVGAIHTNRKSSYIQDLDTVPLPARDLFEMNSYFRLGYAHDRFRYKPFAQMITSRGCPFNCTFCALGNHWGSVQRLRSPENVLAEIDVLVKEFGVREIHFEDDNLTADKARAMTMFNGLREREYGIAWTAPTGMAVASLDEELLKTMAASGCYSVTLAIESGNQEVLSKLMRKPVALKKVARLVKAIRSTGMLAKGFFMIGYPGETKGTIRETVEFARNLELDWAFFFIATPLPYTEMYNMAIKEGYLAAGDFNPLTSLYESVIKTPEFDTEYLTRVREEAIIDINFRNNRNLLKYNVDQAIADFEYVLSLYPHFDFAHEALGSAYLKKGWRDRACASWRRALTINVQNHDAAAKLREVCGEL
jgi:anaerobic magnesium-protoporphyrin IX monomethyl ester cyclase